MPFDLPAEHVLPLLDARGGEWASNARSAWDSLTASGDVPVVTLHDLEYFLWYTLPTKFLMSPDDHRAIATALGEMLRGLGYEAAGELCRGPVTTHVLAEWGNDSRSGYRALTKALEDSGVEPPDTEALEWGGLMGLMESTVFDRAAEALEDALSRGEFTPGRRGWKRAQGEVMRRFLMTPLHALDEWAPQVAVWEERQEAWSGPPHRTLRQAFIRPVRDAIRRPPAVPGAIADQMRPLFRLLELTAAGLPLTHAGYVPPSIARALVREFGWWRWEKPPRSEADVPQLMTLRELTREAGLVRRARDRLRLTDVGRRGLSDPVVVWSRVVRTLSAGTDFAAAIRELLLVHLLQGPSDCDAVLEAVVPVLTEARWTPGNGRELTRNMVSFNLWKAIRPMDLLNMVHAGEWPDRSLALTDFGAVAARAVLWHRATAPGHSVW
jgi:hypothetical protein